MSELNKIVTNFPMSLSQDENRNLALTLSAVLEGGGGGVANAIWKPAVDQDGLMTWSWDTFPDSARPPETVNIKGPRGESGAPGRDGTNGTNGTDGKDGLDGKTPQIQINSSNAHWEWRYSGASEWTDLGVVASGEVGPQGIPGVSGAPGAPGAKGEDGYSPSVTTSEIPVSTEHPQGGTSVTITDKTGQHQFDVWNGINGEGATVNLLDGSGIHIEQNGTNYTIGVSADYALRSELPDVTDMATETWVAEQGYLTVVPDSYATKSYVNEASANALSQAESWVETRGYLQSVSVAANGSLQGAGTTNSPLSLKTSAEQAIGAVANKIDKPAKTTGGHKYVLWDTTDEIFSQFGPVFYQYYAASLGDSITSNGSVSTEFEEGEPNYWTIGLKTSAENALASVSAKFDKPTNLSNGTYSLHVAGGTFSWQNAVDPSTVLYSDEVLGVNGVSADWVGEYFDIGLTQTVQNQLSSIANKLDKSGGTVSGEFVVSGGSNFDTQNLKFIRENQNGFGRIGLGNSGPLALKVDDANNHTTQVNINPNPSTNDGLIQVQHGGSDVGFLIPAKIEPASWTPSTDDRILHIVLES